MVAEHLFDGAVGSCAQQRATASGAGPMSSGLKEEDHKRLEAFDGTDTSLYKKWRRRAELYLMALPTTFPKERWGAKLVEHLRGEAEECVEDLPLEKIMAEDGYKTVFSILDEKYQNLKEDEMHQALREYFYTVSVRSGESFRNFIARQDNVYRRLVQHGIKLPEEVQGWFLLKKLHLDSSQEALVLTSTSGSLQKAAVTKALRAIFPSGKGQPAKKSNDVFEAESAGEAEEGGCEAASDGDGFGSRETLPEVMEAVAETIQGESEYEDEDALEVFESYREIKKRVQEKKISRGFKGGGAFAKGGREQWNLSGTINANQVKDPVPHLQEDGTLEARVSNERQGTRQGWQSHQFESVRRQD